MTMRTLLLLLVVFTLGNARADTDVADLTSRAEAALQQGDADTALESYLAILESDPDNRDAVYAAARLASDLGIDELALELAIREADLAAGASDKAAVMEANARISELHAQLPDWIDAKLAEAGAYDDSQSDAVQVWQEMSVEAESALADGDADAAVSAQQSAVFVANETFGKNHWITIAAVRDLGFVYRQAGDVEEAETWYNQALSRAEQVLGETHPRTLEIASLLAELYSAAGSAEQALAMRQMTVDGLTSSVGADHEYTVAARLSAVDAQQATGQYEDAIATALDLCGDIERAYGIHHPDSIRCLEFLGRAQMTAGALADAERTYEEIAGLMGFALADVDAEVLDNLSQLAEIYRQEGRYRDSKDLLSKVIQLALQTGNVESSYVARSYLGRVLNNEGDYANAQQVSEEVLDYAVDHWQDQPLNIYNTLLELGAVYQARGKLADAEATFQEAYQGLQKAYGANHPSTLVATNDLGQLYEKIGLYDDAEPLLKSALQKFEENLGPEHPDAIRARNNLALLYESQGNFREAEPLYLESLELMREVHGEDYTDTIAVKNNLAYLYMLMEEFDRSAAMFEEVRGRWEAMFGPDHQNTLKAANNLARVYEKMGKLDAAEPIFVETLERRSGVLGEDHLDTIRSMIDLGGLYLRQGRLNEANRMLTDALQRAERVLTPQHPYTFDALNLLARTKAAIGNLEAAADLLEKGLQRRSEFLDRMLWTTGENAREGYLRLLRPEFNEYMSLLARLGGAASGRRVIDASLQRKGLLLKVTSEIQQIATLSRDPALKDTAEKLEAARKQLAAMTLSGPTAETQGRHAEILYGLERKVNELQGEMGRASIRFRTSIARMNSSTLERALADNTALVDFLFYEENGEERMLAGVAVKEDGKVRYDLVRYADRKQVQDAVVEYRTYIQDDLADEADIREAGRAADRLIWEPVEAVLGDIEVVYVVPDGILNILPFNALVDNDEKYLIQTHDIRILTSGRDLLPNSFKLAQGDYIILAGPDYDSEDVIPQEEIEAARGRRSSALQLGLRGAGSGLRGLAFSPLPGAEQEGRIITEQVVRKNEPSVVYFGKDAQEQVLGGMTSPPEILHMATHGFFLEADDTLRKRLLKLQRGIDEYVPPPGDNPLLRAGLAFAGINNNARFLGDIDTANDGVLTALEVLDLDLSGTQLVVLSACETGLGEIHEGEGVYGLRRAFQEAGVAEVISSLWEVSDAGTQALMTDFYSRLLAGEPARKALRETQLGLIDSPQWGYPYIWSAFMIVGSYESAGFTVQ
jgi:CHAT domain-containing protein/Tfp pilus assembly protein PilF